MELGRRLADAIRREREARGLSLSELARRAGVSKATVSQLEAGSGNPSIETLWAIATAMDTTFAVLVEEPSSPPTVVRRSDAAVIPAALAPYTAALLSASPPHARRDLYYIRAEPGAPRLSSPHQRGTTEHVVLVAGHARVGPADDPVTLGPGDYVSYPGDAPHVFEALEPDTAAVLVSEVR